ncbi:tRNA-modifying protein YgfZ [Kushneria pakistanensis]|uniref:tRNA-modifying protein YgfZ n=1 Tax=Kushneria pakistanensis TaxID=1508770 RepID=A0ABQ3FEG0_9GAMM|nr:folate-binding protein YgfZ [Kushneria pakistanensis]GHC20424.1 tRNA-modifying protein YgfZ [Kushneria pakistanensis]
MSHPHWQTFLQHQSAEPSLQHPTNAAPDLLHATALVSLDDRVVLEVRGPDSEKFLQGQTSASTAHATSTIAPPTVFCTPKGRAIANAQLIKAAPECYWLLLERSIADALHQHLAKYAAFYKAELTLRDDLTIAGIAGQHTLETLGAQIPELPQAGWGVRVRVDEELAITRHPHDMTRLILIAPEERLATLCQTMSAELTLAPATLWQRLDIEAGLLWLDELQREKWLPQMFNWEALAGISFKKGCYTGQEVVARAHYRGQVKKRLMRLSMSGDQAPAAGTEVSDAASDKGLGEVVSSAPAGNDHVELLAVLTLKDDMPALAINGQPAHMLPLPYALERLDPETLLD